MVYNKIERFLSYAMFENRNITCCHALLERLIKSIGQFVSTTSPTAWAKCFYCIACFPKVMHWFTWGTYAYILLLSHHASMLPNNKSHDKNKIKFSSKKQLRFNFSSMIETRTCLHVIKQVSCIVPTYNEGGFWFGLWFELDRTGCLNYSMSTRHSMYIHIHET